MTLQMIGYVQVVQEKDGPRYYKGKAAEEDLKS